MGTPFALCEESALRLDYKEALLQQVAAGEAQVVTDPLASPTGFPFKVAQLPGSASDQEVYERRPRICDLGYLREPFRTAAGTLDYRCAGEPATVFNAKGGRPEETVGRKCLCNALLANIGQPQVRNGKHEEPGLVTAGNDLTGLTRFMAPGKLHYSAADVIGQILGSGVHVDHNASLHPAGEDFLAEPFDLAEGNNARHLLQLARGKIGGEPPPGFLAFGGGQ